MHSRKFGAGRCGSLSFYVDVPVIYCGRLVSFSVHIYQSSLFKEKMVAKNHVDTCLICIDSRCAKSFHFPSIDFYAKNGGPRAISL